MRRILAAVAACGTVFGSGAYVAVSAAAAPAAVIVMAHPRHAPAHAAPAPRVAYDLASYRYAEVVVREREAERHAFHEDHLAHVALVKQEAGPMDYAQPILAAAPPPPTVRYHGKDAGYAMLQVAESRKGDWYVWGAAGPDTFDCSGLVYWSALQLGITSMPRDTYEMLATGVAEGLLVQVSDPQPGDLAFFGTGHVEFYVSPGVVFGALESGTQVGFQDYSGYWSPTMFFAVT